MADIALYVQWLCSLNSACLLVSCWQLNVLATYWLARTYCAMISQHWVWFVSVVFRLPKRSQFTLVSACLRSPRLQTAQMLQPSPFSIFDWLSQADRLQTGESSPRKMWARFARNKRHVNTEGFTQRVSQTVSWIRFAVYRSLKTVVTSEIKLKQNNFTETKHCFAFVLFKFYFSYNHGISLYSCNMRKKVAQFLSA